MGKAGPSSPGLSLAVPGALSPLPARPYYWLYWAQIASPGPRPWGSSGFFLKGLGMRDQIPDFPLGWSWGWAAFPRVGLCLGRGLSYRLQAHSRELLKYAEGAAAFDLSSEAAATPR